MSERYGVVAYVTSPVGKFVEGLRRELRPAAPRAIAHLTILPPRLLCGSEAEALAALRPACERTAPFAVELGKVGTFLPGTPTVYVCVANGAERMRELHQKLNAGPLGATEGWPYVPHLTIVKMETPGEATAIVPTVEERWKGYEGTRRIEVTELAFVREQEDLTWIDLGHFLLSA